MPDTVSTATYAATHGVTPESVWRWVKAGKVRAVRIGHIWRVDPTSPRPDSRSGPKVKGKTK